MGAKSSKRQSYTPGAGKDTGIASSGSTNGGISASGANGQVALIANKDAQQQGDVISVEATASGSPAATSPKDKKKRKTPRFVFSRKRTGSGKRSRKGKKEANGIRPTSYPPATMTGSMAPSDGKENARAQSMFVEEGVFPEDLQPEPGTSALGGDKDVDESSRTKKSSTDSSNSQKDKKKNGSFKLKSPKKKKEKGSKSKDKKKKKEEDNEAKKSHDLEEKMEEKLQEAAPILEEMISSQTKNTEAAPRSQTGTAEIEVRQGGLEEERGVKVESTEGAMAEEAGEAVVEVTVASVSKSEMKVKSADNTTDEAQGDSVQSTLSAEGLFAEIEKTIINKEKREAADNSFQMTKDEVDGNEIKAETITGNVTPGAVPSGEPVVLTGHWMDEDILELSDIVNEDKEAESQTVARSVSKEREDKQAGLSLEMSVCGDKEPAQEEPRHALGQAVKDDVDSNTVVSEISGGVETVVKEDVVIVEVQSSVQAVRQEPVSEIIQQHVETLTEASPKMVTSGEIAQSEDKKDKEAVPIVSSLQTNNQLGDISQVLADIKPEDAAPEETTTESSDKPADQTPPLSPAQLKAMEKEQRAAKKREAKEKARIEKEEKKRLKEQKRQEEQQKKREAKEKKQREKEERARLAQEAKERTKAAANMTIEVKNEDTAEGEGAALSGNLGIKAGDVSEVMTVSQTVTTEATPSKSSSSNLNLDVNKTLEVQPGTSFQSHNVEKDIAGTSTSTTFDEDKTDGSLLGCSVKDIISTIQHSVSVESKPLDENIPSNVDNQTPKHEDKTIKIDDKSSANEDKISYDEPNPPVVPIAPYPDEEEDIESSVAENQFSSPMQSPVTSTPASPTTLIGEAASRHSLEISESARSGVLRKIELGPRLRTAILRKSSSGAESEEKRVSLTQPRHVQVSDLTPPPRKPHARRPLEYTRGSFSNSDLKKVESVVEEEHLTVELASSNECSSLTSPSRDKEEKTESENIKVGTLNQQWTVTTTPLTQIVELTSSSPTATVSTDNTQKGETLEIKDQISETLAFRTAADVDSTSPALASVASIVLAGQTETPDIQPRADAPLQHSDSSHKGIVSSSESQSPADEVMLQKVAADVVEKVQKAAQEQAAALVCKEDGGEQLDSKDNVLNEFNISSYDNAPQESGDGSVSVETYRVAGVANGEGYSDKDSDCDSDVGLVQATVVCSAELVSSSQPAASASLHEEYSQNKDSSQPQPNITVAHTYGDSSKSVKSTLQGAIETSEVVTDSVLNKTAAMVSGEQNKSTLYNANTDSVLVVEDRNTGNQDTANNQPDSEESPDIEQLQLFNKNYYGIASLIETDDDDDTCKTSINQDAETLSFTKTLDMTYSSKNTSEDQSNGQSPQSIQKENGERNLEETASSVNAAEDALNGQSVQSLQTENGDNHGEVVPGQGDQELVRVRVGCNGSGESHEQNEDSTPSSVDVLLKLHGGLNGDKNHVCGTLEHNNNIPNEDNKTEISQSAISATTNDSRD